MYRRRTESKRYHPYSNEESLISDNDKNFKLNTMNPFKKIFNFGDDDSDVYRESNHIYFKTDVNTESIDKLYKLIRLYQTEVDYIKSNNQTIADVIPKELYIHITSYGGSLHEAYLAYDVIKRSKIKINTIVEGYAASAGTIMSVAGNRRYITPTSIMLIHQLSTGMGGKFEEIKDDFQNSEQDMKKIIALYLKECNGKMKKKFIIDQLKHDKWWSAEESLKYGLVDEIVDEIIY
jgi:ATP-dependent Clp endopeptidase proteolytic subunit ClpP